MSEPTLFNLSQISHRKSCFIQEMQNAPETAQRLRELGFREHSLIRTITNSSSRIICEVNNTRIGIHHRVAKGILVSFDEMNGL